MKSPQEDGSRLKRFALPAALAVGGVTIGAAFAPIGLASAQNDDTAETESTESESTDSESTDSDSARRNGKRGNASARSEVFESLGLDTEVFRQALKDGQTMAEAAEAQGVSPDDLSAGLEAAFSAKIDDAVASGKLTAEEAAEKKAGVAERVEETINSDPRELKGDRGSRKSHKGNRGAKLENVAELLGLSTDEIREAVEGGQTLAELAEAQGVSEDQLVAALMEGVQEKMDQAVENDRLDADDADAKLAEIEERMVARINGEMPEGEDGERDRSRRGNGKRGHGTDGETSTDDEGGDA